MHSLAFFFLIYTCYSLPADVENLFANYNLYIHFNSVRNPI